MRRRARNARSLQKPRDHKCLGLQDVRVVLERTRIHLRYNGSTGPSLSGRLNTWVRLTYFQPLYPLGGSSDPPMHSRLG